MRILFEATSIIIASCVFVAIFVLCELFANVVAVIIGSMIIAGAILVIAIAAIFGLCKVIHYEYKLWRNK